VKGEGSQGWRSLQLVHAVQFSKHMIHHQTPQLTGSSNPLRSQSKPASSCESLTCACVWEEYHIDENFLATPEARQLVE